MLPLPDLKLSNRGCNRFIGVILNEHSYAERHLSSDSENHVNRISLDHDYHAMPDAVHNHSEAPPAKAITLHRGAAEMHTGVGEQVTFYYILQRIGNRDR